MISCMYVSYHEWQDSNEGQYHAVVVVEKALKTFVRIMVKYKSSAGLMQLLQIRYAMLNKL